MTGNSGRWMEVGNHKRQRDYSEYDRPFWVLSSRATWEEARGHHSLCLAMPCSAWKRKAVDRFLDC